MPHPDPAAPPTASTSASCSAEVFLSQVEGWILKLAMKLGPRIGLSPAEFAAEVRIDVFLHLDGYNPAKGRPTTWVSWRVRKVYSQVSRSGMHRQGGQPQQFSQIGGVNWDGEDRDASEAVAIAKPDPSANAGQTQRREDEAELRESVRVALAKLPPCQRRSIELLYGIDREAVHSRAGLLAATGVTAQAVHFAAKYAKDKLRGSKKLLELARDLGLATRTPTAG